MAGVRGRQRSGIFGVLPVGGGSPAPVPAPTPAALGMQLHLDTAADGTFGTDWSDRLLAFRCGLGMRRQGQLVQGPMRVTIKVRNDDNKASPEHASALSGLSRSTRVRLRSTVTNQAGPALRQAGIGDQLPCPTFDGVDDFVQLPAANLDAALDPENFTLACWINLPAANWSDTAAEKFILTLGADASNRVYLKRTTTANQLEAGYVGGGTADSVTHAPSASERATWLHLALIVDRATGNAIEFVVNGVSAGTSATLAAFSGALADPRCIIGAETDTTTLEVNGCIAHVAFWSTKLTVAECLALYEAPDTQTAKIAATQAASLEAHYPLSEETALGGQWAGDTTGNNFDATYSTETKTRNLGHYEIERIDVEPGPLGKRTATLHCIDWMARARNTEVEIALQESKTGAGLISALVAAAGPDGHNGDSPITVTGDTGLTSYPYAFDNKPQGANLLSLLRHVADSDLATLFVNRDGELVYWSMHHTLKSYPDGLRGTLSSLVKEMGYSYGATVVNRVKVKFHPRRVETGGGPYVIARLNANTPMEKHGTINKITLNFLDDSGARISTSDPIDPPVAYTDFTLINKHGADRTWKHEFQAVTFRADSVLWEVISKGGRYTFVAGATQRGNDRITDHGAQEVVLEDTTSQATHGVHDKVIDAPLIPNFAIAESIAGKVLQRWANPVGEVRSVSFDARRSSVAMELGMGLDLGDEIKVADTHLGLDQRYFITGVQYSMSGKRVGVTFYVEPRESVNYWLAGIRGYNEIDTTSRVAYG